MVNLQMKKIVIAIFTLQGNGAERFALTLAKGLVDAGHEAHIVYFKNIIDLPIPENIQLHFFDYQKYRAIPKFMRAKFAAKAFDKFVRKTVGEPDLVLSNLYPVDFILAHSQLPNVHMVIHNTTSQEYAEQLKNSAFLDTLKKTYLAKPCVGVSQGVTDDFKLLFGHDAPIITIYNPIDVDTIQKTADDFVPEYQDYIVHVGKFKPQKRHDILIKACAQAHVPQKLVLVGTGDLMDESKQLVKDLGVEDKVIFAGFQKNPYPFIKHARLMVVSSDFEGLGLVILEALALSTPVISTDCPSGPAEILAKENLVAVQDVEGLADKICQTLQNEADLTVSLHKQFYPQHAVQKYIQLDS
jgi:glycosyltransferase involved in cell wall biosynthesis